MRLARALRDVWTATTKADFIKKIRRDNRSHTNFLYVVQCVECDMLYGQSEKKYFPRADGSISKKESICYQVDHVEGITPLLTLDDLSQHAKDLFHGPMQILCVPCHKEKTKKQAKSRKEKSNEKNEKET